MNDDSPKQTKEHGSELDRYERLQNAAETQIKRIGVAYEIHASLIRVAVIFAGSLAGIIVAMIGYGLFHSIPEFEQKMQDNLNAAMAGMTNRVELKIAEIDRRIEVAVDERLQGHDIETLITNKVEAKVDTVTEEIIEGKIHRQIDPEFSRLTNDMVSVRNGLDAAKVTSQQVSDVLDLAMNIVAAENDDRSAFEKLATLQMEFTNRYHELLVNVVNKIVTQEMEEGNPFVQVDIRWDALKFDPDKATFNDYMVLLGKMPPGPLQAALLRKFSQQTRFPREQKLSFYQNSIVSGRSLELLWSICNIVNTDAQIGENVLGWQHYLQWVNLRLAECVISNRTSIIITNQNDETAYLERAIAFEAMTNFTMARKDLDKIMALNPTNSDALNGYAWFLATCPDSSFRDGKRAVELATESCELTNWKQWNCIGTLGAAYAEAGDFDQAINFEKQAINAEGISAGEKEHEIERLKLFERHQPTHEMTEYRTYN